MRRGGKLRLGSAAAIGALAVTVGGAGLAWGAETIRSSAIGTTYRAQTYEMAAGEVPIFANESVGGVPHDVAARANGPDGRFLFKSAVISPGKRAPVRGAQYLQPGTYPFFCTIHGPAMSASLKVGPGDPVPRPRLRVRITTGDITLPRGGKLPVKLANDGSAANGVTLVARLGRKRIAIQQGVSAPEGSNRQLTLRVNRQGRQALRRVESALVTVTASVQFAKRSTTRQTLG